MIENLRATNSQGLSITFDESFRLTQGLDLSGLTAQVNASETTGAGSRYQNTRINSRNLDLEFQIRRKLGNELTMDDRRALMYRVFNPESKEVRFDFNLSNGDRYYFTAHTTATPLMPPGKTTNNDAYQLALVQMVCTDPYIYASDINSSDIATYEGGFIFPLIIPNGVGIQMGTRLDTREAIIFNEGTGDIGMTITLTAMSALSNPSIFNTRTNENISLNFDMQDFDVITINTSRGNRTIMLTRNGITSNIFNSFNFLNSTFFQLHSGENIISYSADSGVENLSVRIEHNDRYVGV